MSSSHICTRTLWLISCSGYVPPEDYTGVATLTQIAHTISDTHFELVFKCEGCWAWNQGGADGNQIPDAEREVQSLAGPSITRSSPAPGLSTTRDRSSSESRTQRRAMPSTKSGLSWALFLLVLLCQRRPHPLLWPPLLPRQLDPPSALAHPLLPNPMTTSSSAVVLEVSPSLTSSRSQARAYFCLRRAHHRSPALVGPWDLNG